MIQLFCPACENVVWVEATEVEPEEARVEPATEESSAVCVPWQDTPARFVPLSYRAEGGCSPGRLPLFSLKGAVATRGEG